MFFGPKVCLNGKVTCLPFEDLHDGWPVHVQNNSCKNITTNFFTHCAQTVQLEAGRYQSREVTLNLIYKFWETGYHTDAMNCEDIKECET